MTKYDRKRFDGKWYYMDCKEFHDLVSAHQYMQELDADGWLTHVTQNSKYIKVWKRPKVIKPDYLPIWL